MQTPTDKQVEEYIDSVPDLRETWGIPGAKRLASVLFVIMTLLLLVLAGGVIAYFALVDSKIAMRGVSGLIIVVVLAYAASAVRLFQLRAERSELPSYQNALAAKLTGDPKTDPAAQEQVDASFRWESKRYQFMARMIGLAGLVIIAINTYQIGGNDFARTLLFDAAILVYLSGALWSNYAFKADLIQAILLERCRATIVWQHEHPGEAQREEDEENGESGSKDDAAKPGELPSADDKEDGFND